MLESIFNHDVLRAALGRLDLAEVARRTVEVAEDYMPGCAWLDSAGIVHYAETLGEVEGLVLCQWRERSVYAMQLGEVSTYLDGATRQANEIYGTCAPSEPSKCEESTLPLLSDNLPSRVISRVI